MSALATHDGRYRPDRTYAAGNVVEHGKLDRSKIVGDAIPSGAMIAVLQSGPQIYIGVEGGVKAEKTIAVPDLNVYYWRQQF